MTGSPPICLGRRANYRHDWMPFAECMLSSFIMSLCSHSNHSTPMLILSNSTVIGFALFINAKFLTSSKAIRKPAFVQSATITGSCRRSLSPPPVDGRFSLFACPTPHLNASWRDVLSWILIISGVCVVSNNVPKHSIVLTPWIITNRLAVKASSPQVTRHVSNSAFAAAISAAIAAAGVLLLLGLRFGSAVMCGAEQLNLQS